MHRDGHRRREAPAVMKSGGRGSRVTQAIGIAQIEGEEIFEGAARAPREGGVGICGGGGGDLRKPKIQSPHAATRQEFSRSFRHPPFRRRSD